MNHEQLGKWLKGDVSAIAMIRAFSTIAEVWDDIIDGDNPSKSDVNSAFYLALVTLPRNTFYREHFVLLNPIVEAAIFDWHAANAIEATGQHKETTFMLKCTAQLLTVMSARIIGGPEWAVEVNTEMRRLGETFTEYAHGEK